MELSEFLLARVAEDEAVARYESGEDDRDRPNPYSNPYGSLGGADPARVLAECAAKRAVVELHASLSLDGGSKLFDRVLLPSLQQVTKEVLMRLAQPYADHPDFDEAWRC